MGQDRRRRFPKSRGVPSGHHLLLGLLPGLIWLWHFRRQDAWEPEPRSAVARVFALGCASAVLILHLRPRAETLLPLEPGLRLELADAFLVTALLEESAKLLALYAAVRWDREWDEPMDGVVYGAAAGLGFASFENAVYLSFTADPTLLVGRAATSTLAHACFSACAGFLAGLAKLRGGRAAVPMFLAGLALATLLHGSYDALLLARPGLGLAALLLVLPASLVLTSLALRWARARSPLYHPRG